MKWHNPLLYFTAPIWFIAQVANVRTVFKRIVYVVSNCASNLLDRRSSVRLEEAEPAKDSTWQCHQWKRDTMWHSGVLECHIVRVRTCRRHSLVYTEALCHITVCSTWFDSRRASPRTALLHSRSQASPALTARLWWVPHSPTSEQFSPTTRVTQLAEPRFTESSYVSCVRSHMLLRTVRTITISGAVQSETLELEVIPTSYNCDTLNKTRL